jgi:hypothetical protein
VQEVAAFLHVAPPLDESGIASRRASVLQNTGPDDLDVLEDRESRRGRAGLAGLGGTASESPDD